MLRLGLGPQIASNTPSENSLDPDAQAYFTTSGVTDYTAKIQISDFVKGIKNLNLWSSMVCWPLRSSQNAGTGTTAYSLGGFGTYNGTLVNSPTWNTDGVDFTSSLANYISTTFYPSFQYSSAIIISKSDDVVTTKSYFGQVKADWLGMRFRRQNDTVRPQLGGQFINSISLSLLNFNFISVAWDSTTSISVLHNATEVSLTLPASPSIGAGTVPAYNIAKAGDFAEYWDGKISFFAIILTRLTFSQMNSIRTICKTSVGDGLSLP